MTKWGVIFLGELIVLVSMIPSRVNFCVLQDLTEVLVESMTVVVSELSDEGLGQLETAHNS